ncbi:MAG: hypothetical protein V7K86_07370 [Nostoc sp.]
MSLKAIAIDALSKMALGKGQRLMSPRSQPPGWERILRGSASFQEREGGSPSGMGSQPGGS